MPDSLSPEYFEKLYDINPDPWNFTHSDYEARKYQKSLATLDRPSYAAALEIGCSIGVFTQMLAPKCGHLLSIDVSEKALAQARERNAGLANVTFELRIAPHDLPADGCFDLTVLSEVGYYWTMPDLQTTGSYIDTHTAPQGQFLMVHWLPLEPDHRTPADEVHEYFLSRPQWQSVSSHRSEKYRIDLLQKLP